MKEAEEHRLCDRFRGFLPVIIDVETGGFIARTDAILEIAATTVRMDENGVLSVHRTHDFHLQPFEGANIEQSINTTSNAQSEYVLPLALRLALK